MTRRPPVPSHDQVARAGGDPRTGLPAWECPACRCSINAATPIVDEGVRPTAGDFSLCFACGALLQFDDSLIAQLAPPGILDTESEQLREELGTARAEILARNAREAAH